MGISKNTVFNVLVLYIRSLSNCFRCTSLKIYDKQQLKSNVFVNCSYLMIENSDIKAMFVLEFGWLQLDFQITAILIDLICIHVGSGQNPCAIGIL